MKLRALSISLFSLSLALVYLLADIPKTWSSGSNYNSGDLVIHNGTTYQAQQAISNSQTAPSSDASAWQSLDTIAAGKSDPTGKPSTTPDTSSLPTAPDTNETDDTEPVPDTDDPDLPNAGSTDVVLRGISTAGYTSDTSKLSGGFAITGGSMTVLATGKGGKEYLFDSSGAPYAFQDTLTDPQMQLKLLTGTTALHTNADWSTGSHVNDLTATNFFATASAKDAGLYVTLDAGTYVADVSSADGDSGGTLVEIYDTYGFWQSTNTGAKLTGISTNGIVNNGTQAGERMSAAITIGNFGTDTAATKRIIVMAKWSIGVTSDHLEDPRLEVRNVSGDVIASNDDWSTNKDSVKTAITATGLMSGYRTKDAALILNVAPGSYFMDVYSQDGDSGGSLVEVYDLDLLESIYSWGLGN